MGYVAIKDEHLTGIADAIRMKGGTSSTLLPSQMAAAIEAIPTGEPDPDAKYREGYRWNPPKDWPNLRKIVAEADPTSYGFPATYTQKAAILIERCADTAQLQRAKAYVLSDGTSYASTQQITHTWDKTKDIIIDGRHYSWVLAFSDSAINCTVCIGRTIIKGGDDTRHRWLVTNGNIRTEYFASYISGGLSYDAAECDGLITGGLTLAFQSINVTYFRGNILLSGDGGDRTFNGCKVLFFDRPDVQGRTEEKNASIIFDNATIFRQTFRNCDITELPRLLGGLSNAITANELFSGCKRLTKLWDDMDLSNATNCSNIFYDCYGLESLPTNLKINLSFSFAQSLYVTDKDSVATFAEDGTVNGGMVGNLNTCVNDGQTVTLNASIKELFTETEQTAIADCLTSKNWGLVW